VTLPAFVAAERRAATPLLFGADRPPLLSIDNSTLTALSSKPAARRGHMDRWTDARHYVDPA